MGIRDRTYSAERAGQWGGDTAHVTKVRDGTWRARGAGFAGRVRYRSADRAKRIVESHARFIRWL